MRLEKLRVEIKGHALIFVKKVVVVGKHFQRLISLKCPQELTYLLSLPGLL